MSKHREHPRPAAHTRRGFLQLGAVTAAGILAKAGAAHARADVAPDVDPGSVPEDPRAFSLGVNAGDPTPDSAQLWTHYDGDSALLLAVWRHDGDGWRQVVHHEVPRGARGAVQVHVDALEPFTEYRYTFYALAGDAPSRRSRVGRFKTAPVDDALVPVRIGATCCTMNGMDQSVLARAGERSDLDMMIQLGDAVYADGSEDLRAYRSRWRENLSQPGYQAFRASTGFMVTWDDHEVDNDWCPASVSPDKLAAARAAFFEHMPVCRRAPCPDRLWRSRRFGKTAEVFVLDCRGERDRSQTPHQYISPEQMDWLKRGLAESPAVFKIIVNSVPITRFPPIFSTSIRDRWETFAEQRTELLGHIEHNHIPGVLFLSGDFHLAMIARASAWGVGGKTMEVLAGPGAQIPHALVPFLFGAQFDWASGRNNVTTLELDPGRQRVDVRYHGHDGAEFHHAAYRVRESGGFDRLDAWLLAET